MPEETEMIQTIIVDDDFLVRSYLKQLNAWEKAGYQITADARDGEEALEIADRLKPDVIFTDISMPLVNGIEFIQKIRKKNKTVYIAALSCHDDFEYVKEAMRQGADEYVLKHSLDEDSLYEMLLTIRRQLQSRKEKAKEDNHTQRLIEMGRHSLKYYYFNSLLAGNLRPEEREQRRKEAGIQGKYINSAVINLLIPKWTELKNSLSEMELEQYSQDFLQKLSKEVKIQKDNSSYTECIYLGEGIFCCFADMSELRRSSLMKQKLTSLATACLRCCEKEIYSFSIGVSSICFGSEGIRQAYQQAREMIKIGFYVKKSILYYEEHPEAGKTLPQEAESLLKHAPSYLKHQQYALIKEEFLKVIDAAKRQYTDSRLLLHWLKSLDSRLHVERTSEQYAQIVQIEQLMDICKEYQGQFISIRKSALPENTSQGVRLAVHYLHSHYREQVGLTETAAAAGLNPSYLSYIFKQELGIGFSAYLLDLRMKYAMELLQNTNEKMKDVASMAGFNDYHYFSKAFKKVTGVSPANYRKSSSG